MGVLDLQAGHDLMSDKARVYLAREAVLAGSEDAAELLKQATSETVQFKTSEAAITLKRVEQIFADRQTQTNDSGMVPASAASIASSPNRLRTSDSRYGARVSSLPPSMPMLCPVTHDDSGPAR